MTNRTKKIIIVVVVVLGLCVIGFLVGTAFVVWKAAQRDGNEAAAQQDLKTIAAVEIQYYWAHNRTFGTFDQMIKEGMLTSKFSGNPPAVDGYVFVLSVTPRSANQPCSYAVNADPQSAATGRNHFYIDSSSTSILINPDRPASAADEPASK